MSRLLVILDLDETLVHVPDHPLSRRRDFEVHGHAGYARPHLTEFLDGLRRRYDVAIWTSADRAYAEAIVAEIVPRHHDLAFLWSREHCTEHFDQQSNGRTTIKTLQRVGAHGYDLGRVIMVDDAPEKHLRDYENLVPVAPFLGDYADRELPAVAAFIHTLAAVPDVRSVDKRFWHRGMGS